MDDYIRTSERFRVIRVFSGVPGSYGNTRKKQWASWAKWWKRGGRARGPPSPNRIGLGGRAPFPLFPPSPSFSFSFPSPLLVGLGKEGVLLPVGVGLLHDAPSLGRPPPPPCSFIYGGRGAPQDTQVDHRDRSLAVCGAPPPPYSTSVILLRCLGEALRR